MILDSTLQELRETLHESIKQMKQTDHPVAAITSGCELFMRFITLIEDSEVKLSKKQIKL